MGRPCSASSRSASAHARRAVVRSGGVVALVRRAPRAVRTTDARVDERGRKPHRSGEGLTAGPIIGDDGNAGGNRPRQIRSSIVRSRSLGLGHASARIGYDVGRRALSSSRDRPVDHRSEPMSCSTIARGTSVLAGARVDAREASAVASSPTSARSVASRRGGRRARRRARLTRRGRPRDVAPPHARPRRAAAGAALTVALTAPSAVWADAAPGDASAAAAKRLSTPPPRVLVRLRRRRA